MQRVAFGHLKLSVENLFFFSEHCFASVNLKPVVPGHALVISRRKAKRLADLTPEETADLFVSARTIGAALERHYGASSLTLALQDGKEAGQTVEHVHVHILPRRPGDFERNDDIYDKLENKDEASLHVDSDRKPRDLDDMKEEACTLRTLFPSNATVPETLEFI